MLEPPRSSGILLRPSSLPGRFGMGEIGPEAQRWLELLARTGQAAWVIPAMHPADGLAGDPMLLGFDALRNDGVLLPSDLALLPGFNEHRINHAAVTEVRYAFLQLAARRFLHQTELSPLLEHAFDKFCDDEAAWLDDWSLHAALAHANEGRPWYEWPRDLALREPAAMAEAMVDYSGEIEEHKVLQFLFARHWQRLRARAHDLGVRLVGSLPALIERECAAVWAAPQWFELDVDGAPTRIGRVDAEGADAYLTYRWEAHREDEFGWWRSRWQAALRRFDEVRIEHSKALDVVWETDLEGGHGCWTHGPGKELRALLAEGLIEDAELNLTTLEQLKDCTARLAVCDWQSLLGQTSCDPLAWRFTWEEVTDELELKVQTTTAAAGRL